MDNKYFNVKGKTKAQLKDTLKLLLFDEYGKDNTVRAFQINKSKGLILHQYKPTGLNAPNVNEFIAPLDYEALTEQVWAWLHSKEAKEITLTEWDRKIEDGDVSCDLGFRVYNEKWGHVHEPNGHTIDHSTIAAITPSFCWYGK